ncbi:calcium-binding protein [Sedimentitalea nanhaiensis]|uniref:Hemolysin-type calcium-binding repeat-containing protein n=1 Tax=Sedimentitalea nanhaiensis TaxID=999627 RepID=A0A1I7DZN8_9RHOB|nr:calcium-binding protein [Sedimentitalea nanhaiensis]SFU17147.1 Hemolysin-type calcium-binding repeat-containing protein [Sedimentitalea nanhaiensis]
MATKLHNITVDGINDIPRLSGTSVRTWSGTPPDITRMDIYSEYLAGPDDLVATADLTGSNWAIRYFRIAGDKHHTTITDLNDDPGRRIEMLVLGLNSDVDLISTRVDHMVGWDGDSHDVQLGSGYTSSVQLDAETNNVRTGSGDIGSIRTSGTSTIEIGDVWVGSVRTGNGDDTITTGSKFAEFIGTSKGNDTVNIGSGGGLVWLGSGDDIIRISEMEQDGGVSVNGSSGQDTLDFSSFSQGISFDLNNHGWQDVAPATNGALGYVSQLGMENLIGSHKDDTLTGDQGDNVLRGKKGFDTLSGQDGHDVLRGDDGNDTIHGGAGNDRIFGGNQYDILHGGDGNDVVWGGQWQGQGVSGQWQ